MAQSNEMSKDGCPLLSELHVMNKAQVQSCSCLVKMDRLDSKQSSLEPVPKQLDREKPDTQ